MHHNYTAANHFQYPKFSSFTIPGDVILSGAEPHHELGHVLNSPLSRDPDQITLFKNLGLACQDVVTADLIYKQYLSKSAEDQA